MRSQEQAKSTWTCQKSHFVWKFTGKNAHGHVRRAILCGNLQEKRHRHRSQEPFCGFRGPRFGWKLRHMLQEPFCMEIYRKSAGPGFRGQHFVWKFTGKNAHGHVTRAILCGNLQEKCRTHFYRPPLCVEIYRKKRAWTWHKGHFVWKFTGKMPGAPVPTWTYTGPFLLLP